ncbi:DsrE family protein [Maribacter sp. CXY002]|uniref:DsrE family protein n=1 Tax=Maribacter luteocoastalis TaxID=3407671 RepID=UPI003B67B85A
MKFSLQAILFLLLLTGTVNTVTGQKKLDGQTVADLQKTPKYAFVLTTERHFKGVLSMYDLLISNGVEVQDFEIVVKGKVVTQLTKGSELDKFFEKYKDKVRVSVCSVAMEKLGVAEEQLFLGLDVTPTASVRMLQLQALGYNTLTY